MAGRKRKISNIEILRAIKVGADPIATAPELEQRLGISRQGLNPRLKELVKKGYVERREVGSRAVVYWLTRDGKLALDD